MTLDKPGDMYFGKSLSEFWMPIQKTPQNPVGCDFIRKPSGSHRFPSPHPGLQKSLFPGLILIQSVPVRPTFFLQAHLSDQLEVTDLLRQPIGMHILLIRPAAQNSTEDAFDVCEYIFHKTHLSDIGKNGEKILPHSLPFEIPGPDPGIRRQTLAKLLVLNDEEDALGKTLHIPVFDQVARPLMPH